MALGEDARDIYPRTFEKVENVDGQMWYRK